MSCDQPAPLKRVTVEVTIPHVDRNLIALLFGEEVAHEFFVPVRRTLLQWLLRKPRRWEHRP